MRVAAGDVEAARESCHEPGDVEALGQQVRGVGCEEAERDLDQGIVDPPVDLGEQPADSEADGDSAGHHQHEQRAGLPEREAAGGGRDHGEAIDDQAAGVIDHALAFHDGEDRARRAQPLHDRGRGDRIGGGDHGSEHEGRRPGQAGDDGVRDHGDADSGEEDQAEGEQRDRPQVGAEVADRRQRRGLEEQRGQEHEEDDLGRHLDPRDAGHESEREAAQHEHDRIGKTQPAREHGEQGHGHQESERDLNGGHGELPDTMPDGGGIVLPDLSNRAGSRRLTRHRSVQGNTTDTTYEGE